MGKERIVLIDYLRCLVCLTLFMVLTCEVCYGKDNTKSAPRARVIIDNDFAGDPDGLVALAHHLLSPSVVVVGVIGSYFPVNGMPGLDISCGATEGVAKIDELYEIMELVNPPKVYLGGDCTLTDTSTPVASDGAKFIVEEAMRTDTSLPLYIA